ncbi:MAG TPA: sugar nucleotide-binding protein [Sedimentisphaerales bacterium]|nr:sugar nucleotide-binding protein [Sedimentisphaerales bacterium]
MNRRSVLILGASGMLGSMVTDFLSCDEDLSVTAAVRSPELIKKACECIKNVEWRLLEVEEEVGTVQQLCDLGKPDWVVNAIGVIKPYAHDDRAAEVERAILINAAFPHWLARTFDQARILQIATDCVYSGNKGHYVERDKHDALDVYGKTKSLGEVLLPNVGHLRCSIIGPEPKSYVSLLEWFRRQPPDAKVSGFVNHLWNGVTTLHFAKICQGIIKNNTSLPRIQHVIPSGDITKHDLLRCFAQWYDRADIEITPTNAPIVIDRRLATENEELNAKLWKNAGYGVHPPTVEEMVEEMAAFEYRLKDLLL